MPLIRDLNYLPDPACGVIITCTIQADTMSRFDSPCSVVLLFTGAAAVSVLLILLLNAEARNRKLHKDTEIVNGNLFSAAGHKLSKWFSFWRHTNTSQPDVIVVQTSTGRDRRSLKAVFDDDPEEEQRHPIRHGAKHRRKQVSASTTTAPTPPPSITPLSEGNVTASGVEKAPVTRRRLDGHDACYNTYEVLLIIGLTCAVNFAFIFVVMAFVHLCNRGQQVKGLDYLVDGETAMVLPRCDSLLPLVLPSDGASAELRRSSGSYSSVQEYVNSLPDPVHGSMVSLHTLRRFPSSSSSMEDLLFLG